MKAGSLDNPHCRFRASFYGSSTTSAKRSRGQHTENPFESVTLNLAKLSAFSVAEADLRSATIAAFKRGDGKADLKNAMKEVRDKASALAKWSRQHVKQLLKDGP